MENNFLLYFFALAFIIAWGGVVVCSARSVVRSMEKDKEKQLSHINEAASVEYDKKSAYLAVYNLKKNDISFVPKDHVSLIRINAEAGLTEISADGKAYMSYDGSVFFYVSEAQVSEYFNEYRHTPAGLKSWLALEVGIGYFACLPENNEFRLMAEREAIAGFKKFKK